MHFSRVGFGPRCPSRIPASHCRPAWLARQADLVSLLCAGGPPSVRDPMMKLSSLCTGSLLLSLLSADVSAQGWRTEQATDSLPDIARHQEEYFARFGQQ